MADISDEEEFPRGERLEFSASEAAHFERARFEQSMATIGMGMPRLPWEQGVFAEIFNPGNDLVSHAMHLLPPLPGGPTSGFDEEKQTAPAIDPELDVRGADMPIFAKHVKALSDQDYEKKVDLQWTRALATWLAILEGSRFDSLVGYRSLGRDSRCLWCSLSQYRPETGT